MKSDNDLPSDLNLVSDSVGLEKQKHTACKYKESKMRKIRFLIILCLGFSVVFLSSCATEKGIYAWEGDVSLSGWILTVNDRNQASLILPYGEGISISGEAFLQETGSWIFHMDYLEWFSNWSDGWTDARFSVVGSLELNPRGEGWDMTVRETPEIQSVLAAEIRYKETRFYGDRSRDMISRRWTRIQALSPFLQESLMVKNYDFAHKRKGFYSREFLEDTASLLFPEQFGYLEEFAERTTGEGERYVRSEGILWDRYYSQAYLPEELIPVRDSGTLFRDFEEGRDLITLSFTWNTLWETLIPGSEIHFTDNTKKGALND